MFSGYAVYVGDRLVLMLRNHIKSPKDNGVWLVLAEGSILPMQVSVVTSHRFVPFNC